MEIELAVNGTLMRGLELNKTLLAVGAVFVKEMTTAPTYRLWSIDDRYPAMMCASTGGEAIALEVWRMPAEGLVTVLSEEPPGLCIGKVRLANDDTILGVLGEPFLCEGKREITGFGGWRRYRSSTRT